MFYDTEAIVRPSATPDVLHEPLLERATTHETCMLLNSIAATGADADWRAN